MVVLCFVFYTEHTEVYSVDLVQAVLGVYDIKLHMSAVIFQKQLLSQVIEGYKNESALVYWNVISIDTSLLIPCLFKCRVLTVVDIS